MHMDQLLMAKPKTTGQTVSQASALERRLKMAWEGEWDELLADAQRDPRAMPAKPVTEAQRIQRRAQRVSTLAASGEKGRALAAAVQTGMPYRGTDALPVLRDLFPSGAGQEVPPGRCDFGREVLAAAAMHATKSMASPGRLAAPGPIGGRAEHWSAVAGHEAGSLLMTRLLMKVAAGEMPTGAFEAIRTSEIVPLPKPKGGLRPVLLSCVIKRFALKGVAKAVKEEITGAVGPAQFGVGTPGGRRLP